MCQHYEKVRETDEGQIGVCKFCGRTKNYTALLTLERQDKPKKGFVPNFITRVYVGKVGKRIGNGWNGAWDNMIKILER